MNNNDAKSTDNVCCFTGHRPDKLKGSEENIRIRLAEAIKKRTEEGYDTFITGMAPGVDIWAAEEVLKLKSEKKDIKLVCAVPFEGVEKNRSAEQREEFRNMLAESDEIIYVCPKYTRWCFHARDRWMADHAAAVIAVFNGTPGGTGYTVDYAQKKKRDVVIINDAE